jgi:hypothetical protein
MTNGYDNTDIIIIILPIPLWELQTDYLILLQPFYEKPSLDCFYHLKQLFYSVILVLVYDTIDLSIQTNLLCLHFAAVSSTD